MNNQVIAQGSTPQVPTQAMWQWDTTQPIPVATGYWVGPSTQFPSGFAPTKTGLMPWDLKKFVGIPLQYYGNPPCPVDDTVLTGWIRYAEDRIEQQTTVLLTQTWIAAKPTQDTITTQSCGLLVNNASGYQVRGYDYDLEENAYDFEFSRWQDEGWGFLTLRYRPVQSLTYGATPFAQFASATSSLTAVKNTAFIYPLLNTFFRMPPNWNVEDRDFGMIRYVPATNTQMLPLFAMQLAFLGFNESVPGAMWLQYTAGLTPYDYQNRYSFMKELVLCEAAITALTSIQGTINLGAKSVHMTVDGMQYRTEYDVAGPFNGYIQQFTKRREMLLNIARDLVSGPMVNYF